MSLSSIPLLPFTVTATGTIAAHRFVTKAGAQTGADGYAIGVARSAAASGGTLTVDHLGIVPVEAGAAITAGDTLEADSSGRAVTWATSGAKLGIALEAATAAGQFIRVLLIQNVA
jgi:hypothetical protein